MKLTVCSFLLSVVLLLACNKDNDAPTSPIVARWKLNPSIYQGFVNGVANPSSTQNYESTDYIEFRSNGTAEGKALGSVEIYPYSLKGDTLFINNSRKAKVITLTTSTFSYTFNDTLSPTYYTKVTFNLYR